MKTALLTSYEKDAHLLRLGKLLQENDWTIIGSAGTAAYLNEHGVTCRDVAEIVGPPILKHKVVTLSRELHTALLSAPHDAAELMRLGIEPIDLVYVTLYPLEKAIQDPGSRPEDVLEKTDIGGPALLRSAAKGRRLALSNPFQIQEIEEWFMRGAGDAERKKLAEKFAAAAERTVADYVETSARYWENRAR